MQGPRSVAVEVTDPKFRVLTHVPSGADLDEAGRGVWPEDQFTLRLFEEGALRRARPARKPQPAAETGAKRKRS